MSKCKKHPKYRGLHKPINKCSKCWDVWIDRNIPVVRGGRPIGVIESKKKYNRKDKNWKDEIT